jgi:hypothetical protein
MNQRCTTVLYHLLPALAPTNQGHLPDTFTKMLADSLTNITVEMHASRRAMGTRVSESNRSKTFRDRYGDRIADGNLLLTSSSGDDLLPPFYQELGGKQNGESERVSLQREVDQSADAFDVLVFKVSPSQVISRKTFDFYGLSLIEVGTSVLSLSIAPPPRPPPYLTRGPSQATTHRPKPMTSVLSLLIGPCPRPTPIGSGTRRDTSQIIGWRPGLRFAAHWHSWGALWR